MRVDVHESMLRGGIDPKSLPVLQRLVLTADGTVTDLLEAYCGERMLVTVLRQEVVGLATVEPHHKARLGAGDGLRREIVLRGETSGRCQIYADSIIALDRIPVLVRDGLIEKAKGIGHLLLEHRIHTFKEIVECRRETAGSLAKLFEIAEDATLLSRTYIVFMDRVGSMLITEKIPELERRATV